ncbi:MAG: hypothetical protein LBD30_02380 [Verrucomicrobiales bacterium]|jgi:hypothetical protein|nr:hypothetical protein [Verrucomicrobiales bacterium]
MFFIDVIRFMPQYGGMKPLKSLLEESMFYRNATLIFGELFDLHPDWERISFALANSTFTENADEQNLQFHLQDGGWSYYRAFVTGRLSVC